MRKLIPVLCLLASGSAVQAADGNTRLQLATGAQFSSGDYDGTTQTSALVIPFYARFTRERWSLQFSAPWISVRGPQALSELLDDNGGLGSNSGSGGVSSGHGSDDTQPDDSGSGGSGSGGDDPVDPSQPPAANADDTFSGIGDVSITAGYSFDGIGDSPLYLDLRARVRLPTGSEQNGLGAGSTDYAVLAELGYAGRRGGAFLSGGRRLLGRVTGVDRVDGWQAGAGAWWTVTPHVTLGANFDWRDPSVRGGVAPRFAEMYAAWYVNETWKLEINGGTGLSGASADYAAGFTLTWRGGRTRRG